MCQVTKHQKVLTLVRQAVKTFAILQEINGISEAWANVVIIKAKMK